MRSRFLGMEENTLIAAATLLDPCFLACGDQSAAECVTNKIISEVSREIDDPPSAISLKSLEEAPVYLVWQFFDKKTLTHHHQT